jgi:hypothetical protein
MNQSEQRIICLENGKNNVPLAFTVNLQETMFLSFLDHFKHGVVFADFWIEYVIKMHQIAAFLQTNSGGMPIDLPN